MKYLNLPALPIFESSGVFPMTGTVIPRGWSWELGEKPTTFIYFIQEKTATEEGRIKIGISKNPSRRLRNLQTGNSNELCLLGVIPGTQTDELRLHTQFGLIREAGEWFRATPELLQFIQNLLNRSG